MRQYLMKAAVVGLAVGCQSAAPPVNSAGAQGQKSPSPGITTGVVEGEVVVRGLEHAWALAFLPDGRILVTERPGRLRIVSREGQLSAAVAGVPAVYARGQGGLLDVAIDPAFATNNLVYLSYAEPGEGGASTAVARGRLVGERLEGVHVIYRQVPKLNGGGHYGSRLVFAGDGKLFVTAGDRQVGRGRVQDLDNGVGKIVRINPDGTVPPDNPFVGRNGARPEIWSLGHRNAQAATLHPETGDLWTVEHGARGGDELNRPEKGRNYGWPVITYGTDYNGSRIGSGTAQSGMEQPVYFWDPVIAPSGMIVYTGDVFPEWKGDIFVGSMSPGALVRLELTNGRITKEERYLGGDRIRDVQQGPDGFIYVVTDARDGKLMRIRPAAR